MSVSLIVFGWHGRVRGRALVDEADAGLSSIRWHFNGGGYAFCHRADPAGKRRSVLLSRMLMGLPNGDPRMVDHINGDRKDNRRCNLRIVTARGNSQNRGAQRGSASGLRGAHWHALAGKWKAEVSDNGVLHYLGLFVTAQDAADAARAKRTELGFLGGAA